MHHAQIGQFRGGSNVGTSDDQALYGTTMIGIRVGPAGLAIESRAVRHL